VVFWLFTAAYLALCPLTILYALGYLFRPGAEGGLVKTGLIYLSTAPPGASVYLGNQRYTQRTPTVLRDLVPGDYPVKLVLKDHQPWMQTVPVEAERATVLERVLLLPTTRSQRVLLLGPFEQLIPIPGSRFLLLTYGPTTADVIVYDTRDDVSWPLLPMESSVRGARILSHVEVDDSPCVLFRVETREGEKFLWVELRPEANRAEDLTPFIPETPQHVAWDPLDRRGFFALHNGQLNRVDLSAKAIYPDIAGAVLGFGTFEKSLYVLHNDGLLERMDVDGKHAEPLASETWVPRTHLGIKGPVQVVAMSEDNMMLWGARGELLTNRFPYQLAERGVQGMEVDPKREQALVWEKDALGIVRFSQGLKDEALEGFPTLRWVFTPYHGEATPVPSATASGSLAEESRATARVTTGRNEGVVPESSPHVGTGSTRGAGFTRGNRIEQAFWAYEGSHIVFHDADHVLLLEVETYGKPHLYDLLQVKRKSFVMYSDEAGTLYFLDAATGALASLEVLPKREVILLPFPERREERMQRVPQVP